jgi:hypothetical protein
VGNSLLVPNIAAHVCTEVLTSSQQYLISSQKRVILLLSALFWINVADKGALSTVAAELLTLWSEDIACPATWEFFHGVIERCLTATDSLRFKSSQTALWALCTTVPILPAHRVLELQKNILHTTFESIMRIVMRTKEDLSSRAEELSERMADLCIVLREGLHCTLKVCRAVDQGQCLNIGSMKSSVQTWVLDMLGKRAFIHELRISTISLQPCCMF